MKKLGILVFIFALVLGVVVTNMFSFGRAAGSIFKVNWKGVEGSGNVVTERRVVGNFRGIDVGGVYQVEITVQKDFSVTVEADDNIVPMVQTEVEGGTLKISSDGRISPKSTIRIKIGAPDINDLDVSGAANVTLAGIKNAELAVHSSGASKIQVNGETTKLTVDVSGATKVDANDLRTENADVEATGASNVFVNVSGTLKAEATGASHVTYSGTPTSVQKSTSGVGSIAQR